MTPDRLAKVRQAFVIIDNLPQETRFLIHEHGAKPVLDLHARGLNAAQIEQHFTDSDFLDEF